MTQARQSFEVRTPLPPRDARRGVRGNVISELGDGTLRVGIHVQGYGTGGSESFVNNPAGGAVAVMGPTREDFPLSATSFHEEMLRLIFQNGITRYGAMSQLHRVKFVPVSQTEATPDRWTMPTSSVIFA